MFAEEAFLGNPVAVVHGADDLTDDEMIRMEAWFEAKVSLLQKQTRGYTDGQASFWESDALDSGPATQKVA